MEENFFMEKIMGACERILYFLIINFLFLLSNVPVLSFFLFVEISQVRTYLPLFLVCMIPAGPALCAVFFAMNRVIHKTDTSPWKDYKTGYLDSWGRKAGITAVQMLLLGMFWTNIEFFSVEIPLLPLVILFVLLFAVCLLITPDLYLLASRYEMNAKDIFKGAVVLCVTRPVITLGNTAMLAVILILLEIQAGTAVLFMASVYGFMVVFMNQKVLRTIESGFTENA